MEEQFFSSQFLLKEEEKENAIYNKNKMNAALINPTARVASLSSPPPSSSSSSSLFSSSSRHGFLLPRAKTRRKYMSHSVQTIVFVSTPQTSTTTSKTSLRLKHKYRSRFVGSCGKIERGYRIGCPG